MKHPLTGRTSFLMPQSPLGPGRPRSRPCIMKTETPFLLLLGQSATDGGRVCGQPGQTQTLFRPPPPPLSWRQLLPSRCSPGTWELPWALFSPPTSNHPAHPISAASKHAQNLITSSPPDGHHVGPPHRHSPVPVPLCPLPSLLLSPPTPVRPPHSGHQRVPVSTESGPTLLSRQPSRAPTSQRQKPESFPSSSRPRLTCGSPLPALMSNLSHAPSLRSSQTGLLAACASNCQAEPCPRTFARAVTSGFSQVFFRAHYLSSCDS